MSNNRRHRGIVGLSALVILAVLVQSAVAPWPARSAEPRAKKVVLLAGTVHQGPGGHPPGTHEYELTARLLAHSLRTAGVPNVHAEVHFDGWPRDPATLDDADTIVLISDGADRNEQDHPLLVGDRLATIKKQMDRGCGLVVIHWSVFVPNQRGGPEFLEWIGGYFDYQSGEGPRNWFSKIKTAETRPRPASPDHPLCRGMSPFELREEYYYNIRFRENDPRLVPILTTPIPGEPEEQVVAWAVERAGGGRGFGFTGGHFFENWGVEQFRRMVLNAILWTAHVEVPDGGVQTVVDVTPEPPVKPEDKPIQVVIVTGHNHPAHVWRETTAALQDALGQDRRIEITVVTDPEFLATKNLFGHDVVVLNYCNWQREGLSEAAKANFQKYLSDGGGLVIIHFANGAFHASLPQTPASDWPEYRNICRRVWDHAPGKSSHDPYGRFKVHIVKDHPITAGLNSFETIDELYCNQQGDRPIDVLATARSTVTGKDEPMAFVYDYGRGRVFQTVLGHAAESIRTPGAATLIRRGTVWAAGHPQRKIAANRNTPQAAPPKLAPQGQFGAALDPRGQAARAAHRKVYDKRPLTVECWAKLDSKARFNVLLANGSKESAEHWEIYSYAGSGEFSLYLPGFAPAELKSGVDITDGRWHYLAAAFDDGQATLYVDGKLVHETAIRRQRSGGPAAPLFFGGYPPQKIECDGLVDEVRISSVLREIDGLPPAPFAADGQTIGLWHFDRIEAGRIEDRSSVKNAAAARRVGETPPPLLTRRVVDPELKLIPIDSSPDESFLSIKADTMGRLFVGGREALFVYEPDTFGGYKPRQLLYRFPPDSWVNDVEIRGDDLYVMTNAALYLIAGGRTRRDNLKPKRLLWGTPVDMHVTWHGLAWGPEGDLYFSSGDPLLNYGDFRNRPDHWGHWTIYTQPEGTRVPYTGVGGFFRCHADGTGLQVVAGGTRGAVGIAFDRRWNLFSNDNDHESLADRYSPARLLHVALRANFFWPRGWIADMSPERSDLLDVVNTEMGREVPVGQAYYDEPWLPAYRDSLLVARWGQRKITGYALSPRGASYAGREFPLVAGEETARPVGVAVGRGGRIFATLSYMAANEWSPRYPSEIVMITRADDPPTHPYEPYDAPTAEPARLWTELSSPSSWRRRQAHLEIMRRGGPLVTEAVDRLQAAEPGDPAFVHLVWLAAVGKTQQAGAALLGLLEHDDPNIRTQAIRALAEFRELAADGNGFRRALADPHPGVQHAAVVARFDDHEPLTEELFAGPARSADTYLRQASTMLIARRGTMAQIESLLQSTDPLRRLAGVLAAGFRLTVPPSIGELPPELPLRYEAGNAVFVIQYADGTADLKQLGRLGSYTTAQRWKAVRPSNEERRLFRLLLERLADADERVYQQAAYFLSLVDDPQAKGLLAETARARTLDRLAEAPQIAVEQAWMIGPFDDGAGGFDTVHAPEQGPIDLAATPPGDTSARGWKRVSLSPAIGLPGKPETAQSASSYFYFRLQSLRPQSVVLSSPGIGPCKLWHNGRPVPEASPAVLALEPGSNDILLRVAHGARAGTLKLAVRARQRIEQALPEKLGPGTLAERLRTAGQSDPASVPKEFLSVDWPAAAARGDAGRGRKLFGTDALGCAKCHAILPNQKSGGGPSLADAAKRFTPSHLVESILAPSKQVAPVFGTTLIVTVDGQTLSGLVVEENDSSLSLLLPTAARREVAKRDIETRKLQDVSPMPSGLVKTPAELADLLAYLLSADP